MLPYEGESNLKCFFCDELATHSCDIEDKHAMLCRLHFVRTKVEHLATNHRELPAYARWKKHNLTKKKTKPEIEMQSLI